MSGGPRGGGYGGGYDDRRGGARGGYDDRRGGGGGYDDRRGGGRGGYDDRRGGVRGGYDDRRGGGRGGYNSDRRARIAEAAPRGGATHLARIHGTEEDRVNCPFYFKIGACRHGERCSRQHHRPVFSPTVLIQHMWQNPKAVAAVAGAEAVPITREIANERRDQFEEWYEAVFNELAAFGHIEEMHVCDNLGDHMVGNVYVKFRDEEDAQSCLVGLAGRFFQGRPLVTEFSPVTDFHDARCRQFDEMKCKRGDQCNFMHIKRFPRRALEDLIYEQDYSSSSDSSDSSGSSGSSSSGSDSGSGSSSESHSEAGSVGKKASSRSSKRKRERSADEGVEAQAAATAGGEGSVSAAAGAPPAAEGDAEGGSKRARRVVAA